ncbi:hypothetical protein MUP37_05860 [Candidatus Bathyarchaeota archaeon]|nr:hypothetical protein [Candidatus Bathyarchaeota archaeon]
MNERDVYFGDGSWGHGITSFWADNLTKRWSIYDWGASSNIPMLADVNKDGIVDVVSTNLGSGIIVLNSSDGHPLKNLSGKLLDSTSLPINAHYQSTVYDIDGDGNLELMCADGSHGYNGTQVFDLVTWKLEANIESGYAFRGPDVGCVTSDGKMDMIIVTYDPLGSDNGTVQVYNQNYQLIDKYTGIANRAIGSVVQDVDGDGLNELLVLTQGGKIYCFDTLGPSQQSLGLPRARTEIHFYSESRQGAAIYVPYVRAWPDIISPSPSQALNVSTSLAQLSFTLNHPSGQTMSYSVTTTPNIGTSSVSNTGNGMKIVQISGLEASTTYLWQVNVTDQSGHKISKKYWFTTGPIHSNTVPTQGVPILASSNNGNTVNEDISAMNQSTVDIDGNKVANIYNWFRNGTSIDNLNLAFDSKPDAMTIYSGTATTRDYSGNGNTGTVYGATWTPSGIEGGAFYFDGNDFIRVEEQNNSLGGSGTWTQMGLEFWIKIPANAFSGTKTVIWKPDRYSPTSGSYRLDVTLGSTQLGFTWYITTTANNTYKTSFTTTSNINGWHNVACTYLSGTGLKIYLDGSLKTSATGSGYINGTRGPMEIAFNDGNDFVGYLDEVRIYPYAVSSYFVNQRYVETRSGSSSSETIPRADLSANDVWMCQVTPNDGLADGVTENSNSLQIVSGSLQQNRLIINVQGSGITSPAFGTYQYGAGSTVTVNATSMSGYQFGYWLLNGTNVGSGNPFSVAMNGNYVLTAVFSAGSAVPIFTDGFESGSFLAWTGTTTTSGSSAGVTSIMLHSGNCSAQFGVNSGSGVRRSYIYVSLNGLTQLAASSYVYIAGGLPLANGQNMWLIQFVDSAGNALASFGIRADSSSTRWAVQYGSTPNALASSTLPVPLTGQWYLLQAYYAHGATGKTIVLSVNGAQVASLSQNTSNDNNAANARFGICYYITSTAASVYVDDVTINIQSTTPALYSVDLQSQKDDYSTNNLGTTTLGGINYALPNAALKTSGTYPITYSASSGNGFSHWVVTGSASVANIYGQWTTIAVSGSASLQAVYFTALTQYSLHVQVSGPGMTNSTGDTLYNKGAVASVGASSSPGWGLNYWLLDNNNVGSANPFTLTMNGNHNLTAVFTQGASPHLFTDGFESSSFFAWTNTFVSGGSASVVSTISHSGNYCAKFTTSSGSTTRRAYCSDKLANLIHTTANVSVYISEGLPLVNGQNMWLIQFVDSSGNALASFGLRADNSGTKWAVQYGNTPFALAGSSIQTPVVGQWYLLQAYYAHASSGKTITLLVNGVEVASLSQNTSNDNNAANARFGICYYITSTAATTYVDDVTIDGYPTLYDIDLQSSQDNASTTNLGSLTLDGMNYGLPNSVLKAAGTYSITYYLSSGYLFDNWVASGTIQLADSNAQSTTITVSGNGSVTASYSLAPPLYNLHVQTSGSGVTNQTVDTLYVAGSVVSVTGSPNSGWTLSYWLLDNDNVSSTNPYAVTMNSDHNLTAVFKQNPILHLFADGFESGDFLAWSGTTITSVGSATIASTMPHSGSYSGKFSVSSGSGSPAKRAYCYKNVGSLAQLNASAYVYVDSGLPLANGQNMWLIQFIDSGGNALASYGMRADSSGTKWAVQYGNTPYALASSSIPRPATGQWYLLQAYYKHAASGNTIVLYVNGVQVAALARNTSSNNNVAICRFGIDYYTITTAASMYVDDVIIN